MAEDGREIFVGIDGGKDRLDVAIRPLGQGWPIWSPGLRPVRRD